jgi:hypothetical protein
LYVFVCFSGELLQQIHFLTSNPAFSSIFSPMINKHLKGRPYNVNFDIVTDERFRASNECLEKQLKLLKGIGRTITHKQPISITDLRRMYDSGVLGTANPLALLRKVWFEITLHFCHKGSESQEKLLKNSFEIYRDITGRAYVARSRVKDLAGGAPGGVGASITPYDDIRMYETGGDLCPVKSYQLYLVKLHPLQPRLFQQPRRKATPDSPMWYGKAPIGEKALQQMMANISAASKLSKRYTNHCVRTTALEQFSNSRRSQKLKSADIQKQAGLPQHIQNVGSSQQNANYNYNQAANFHQQVQQHRLQHQAQQQQMAHHQAQQAFFAHQQAAQQQAQQAAVQQQVKTEPLQQSQPAMPQVKQESIDHDEMSNLFDTTQEARVGSDDHDAMRTHSCDLGDIEVPFDLSQIAANSRRPSDNNLQLPDDLAEKINLSGLLNADLFNGNLKPLSAEQLAILGQHL